MVFRLSLLLLVPMFGVMASQILTSPVWLGQSLLITYKEVPELERRLSFLTWPEERQKIQRQLSVALKENVARQPFSTASYRRLAGLYINADSQLLVDVFEARFAFMSTHNLANSRPEVRKYIASQCLAQTQRFMSLNLELC
ncbi:MAG: hypothetical protein P8I38_13655 [Arenicella sp.]|jgi:hypothetical protein|nr:hypothetical protein [Arenicella sp.]